MKIEKSYDVSLIIVSETLSLEEISNKIGIKYSSGSHEKGSKNPVGKEFGRTIWRLNPNTAKEASAKEQIESISSIISKEQMSDLDNVEIILDIAVFSNGYTTGLKLDKSSLDIIRKYNAAIKITCYPVSD